MCFRGYSADWFLFRELGGEGVGGDWGVEGWVTVISIMTNECLYHTLL